MSSSAERVSLEQQSLPFWDRWFLKALNDPRDLPFVHLMVGCALMACAGLSLYFVPQQFFWYAAVGYWVAWFALFLDRFILMLHCTSHRRLFNSKYKRLNQLIPWLIGPFFGETPESYFVHHMGMHHPENNLEADLSTTMPFQRDRFTHWLRYYLRFMFVGLVDLTRYHLRKNNTKLVKRLILGEGGFWLFAIGMLFVDWRATLVVFVIPVVFVRTLMMAGNWGQHAFVDASDPGNAYLNSITCINTRYNRRCFNDGYHIHHHVNARTHFTDMPVEFEENKRTYGEQDAIVFDGIDFFQVWLYLMLKRYDWLAKHYVQLPGAPERNRDEVIALMKSRTRAIAA